MIRSSRDYHQRTKCVYYLPPVQSSVQAFHHGLAESGTTHLKALEPGAP
jgi:hypothetical protein